MTRAALAALALAVLATFVVVVAFGAGVARADDGDAALLDDASAELVFQTALASADIDALEALGRAVPATRWSDDALVEAARLAARAGDFVRARASLERAIATSPDGKLVRRARLELERLTNMAGAAGEWSEVARRHEQLVPTLHAGGDPRPVLAELEQLARVHPGYPRAAMLMVAIAIGWELEGEAARAIAWLREARTIASAPADRLRAHADLVRMLTRAGELAAADIELQALAASGAPPGLVAALRHALERATSRRLIRRITASGLALLSVLAFVALRRAAGSWRRCLRRLARPPLEVVFLAPVAAVVLVFAFTGNPLIARAVRTIIIAGLVASWLSGAILDELRGRRGQRIGRARALAHVSLSVIAVGAATYLAVDSGPLINFVIETWLAGHELG